MPSNTIPAREARARRLADRFGLRLVKSRREIDRCNYALVDVDMNVYVFGFGYLGHVADLNDIEAYLAG